MLAGDHFPRAGSVLVPFSGHSHDWAAAELGAWLGHGAVTLLGVRSHTELASVEQSGAQEAAELAFVALARPSSRYGEPIVVSRHG